MQKYRTFSYYFPQVVLVFAIYFVHLLHRDNRTRELAMSRDRGPLCKVKMVA